MAPTERFVLRLTTNNTGYVLATDTTRHAPARSKTAGKFFDVPASCVPVTVLLTSCHHEANTLFCDSGDRFDRRHRVFTPGSGPCQQARRWAVDIHDF